MTMRQWLTRGLPLLLAVAGLAGCTTTTQYSDGRLPEPPRGDTSSQGACGDRFSGDVGVQLSMIRQQLDEDRPRAALAYLDSYGFDYPDARLLRAEALRHTGEHALADRVYAQLEGSCLAADAYRGQALNAASRGDLEEALSLMREARASRPADARIRNDLGYLLLLGGAYGEARQQFLTALELDEGQRNAANNLVLTLMRKGRVEDAERVSARYDLDDGLVAQLRRLGEASLENGLTEVEDDTTQQ